MQRFTPMSNDALRQFMGEIYNIWFVQWRDRIGTATDADWSQITDDASAIVARAGDGETAKAIAYALILELDARRAAADHRR